MIRRTVFFSGRVQGVGFRYTTCRIAARFPVTGYVKNLSDGRVELVVEGRQADLERLIEEISAEMQGHIRACSMRDSEARGEFVQFDVRV